MEREWNNKMTYKQAERGLEQCDLNFYSASSLAVSTQGLFYLNINIEFLHAPYHHP